MAASSASAASGQSAPQRPSVAGVPVPWWAFALAVVGVAMVFLALNENGAVLATQAELLHEFFHDGRHALGVPCH